ncbi:MAG: SprT family zinc-dependent metalloprotease [Amaricoccus sp.]
MRSAADAILIGDPAIEIRLRRSTQARRMVLRVSQGGTAPTLTLPHGVALAQAHRFVVEHEGWLRRHIATAPRGVVVRDGTVLPLGDATVTVRMAEGGIEHRPGELRVPGPAARVGAQVTAWLREEARLACLAAVARHAAQIGRPFGRVSLRDPRSRWGSCSAAGDLMFSWRLVMAPTAVLDYVVAHEVAHLVEMNHSTRFWTVVRRLCPDHATAREWLRRHGASLHGHQFASPA